MSLKGALEPKQETLEEALKFPLIIENGLDYLNLTTKIFNNGDKWQSERMYSEEDLISFAHFYFKEEFNSSTQTSKSTKDIFTEWFEQFKKK
jgi:hypothetical protein